MKMTTAEFKKEFEVNSILDADFEEISIISDLSTNFIREHKNKLNWRRITKSHNITIEFANEFKDCIDWGWISKSHKLTDEFIDFFADELVWSEISAFQNLTDAQIRKHKNKIIWGRLVANRELTEEFIEEYDWRINFATLPIYQKLSQEFIDKHIRRLDMEELVRYQVLSDEFCERHDVKSNILNTIFHCGASHRRIFRTKSEPELIHIGCFTGTKDDAILAISRKYRNDCTLIYDYVSKVNECFETPKVGNAQNSGGNVEKCEKKKFNILKFLKKMMNV